MLREAVRAISEKKIEVMKKNVEQALNEKAVAKLEEMKLKVANSFFGKK